jgi:DMSO/TMAO reductase YedYZ heme-binding membrane subunit
MMQKLPAWLQHWLQGIRLYLGLGIVLVTAEVVWWGRTIFGNSDLATVRIQEVYAWISIILIAVTLLIGPATKIFAGLPGKQQIRESRRLIGIGSAWFALLHAGLAYLNDFQNSKLLELPRDYQLALLLGVIGLVCLALLAFTSVNAIMKAWGIWWFRLHRLIYVSALAVLMHAFMVGAHATSTVALVLLGLVAAIWIGCNIYYLLRGPAPSAWNLIALCYGTILLLAVLNYGLTQHLGYNAVISEHAGHR